MIHIFTCATGIYNNLLLDGRLNNINFLFPNETKTFNIISDTDANNNYLISILDNSYIKFNYYHTCNLVYPFVTLFKYNYIEDACKINWYDDNDYFVYFDATHLCLSKTEEEWDKIIEDLHNYDICYARNPYMRILDKTTDTGYNDWYMLTEVDVRSKHHVSFEEGLNDRDKWCQASFLMGKISGLKKLNTYISQLLLDDIRYTDDIRKKQCILPNFMEQHYMNYIFYHLDEFNLYVNHDKYIVRPEENNIFNKSFLFCHYKHYNVISKKRDSIIYNPML